MSTNGQLVFTDVDKITFKGVGNASNAVIDTLTGKIGVGVDSPDANLHVVGNSYVSTNLELGGTLIMGTVNVESQHSLEAVTATGNTTPLTIEFTNPTTGIVATGNVEVGGELIMTGTGALTVPAGTTGDRPATAVNGMIRYNSTTQLMEAYSAGVWGALGAGGGGNTLNLPQHTSDPATGVAGDIYFNTTSTGIRYHDGTSWGNVSVAPNPPPTTTGGTVVLASQSTGTSLTYNLGIDFEDDVDSDTQLTYTLASGTLPTGSSLPSAGASAMSGTLTTAGTFNFTIQATDSGSKSILQIYQVVVTAPPLPLYTFTSPFTFTNAGATGRLGPTLSQLQNSSTGYGTTGTTAWVGNSNYFGVTGGIQEWTVPEDGTYQIQALGGGGKYSSGATMRGDFTLTRGEIIRILVGQSRAANHSGLGGGGGSFVVRSPYNTTASILVIAGGGGGGTQANGSTGAVGPHGGTTANDGRDAEPATDPTATVGAGGTGGSGGGNGPAAWASGGGAGFSGNGADSREGSQLKGYASSFINGGTGAEHTGTSYPKGDGGFGGGGAASFGGGAGAGGYSGGGGVASAGYGGDTVLFGGGGGSYNSGTNQSNSNGSATSFSGGSVASLMGSVIVTKI
jgi:hypothetical protein